MNPLITIPNLLRKVPDLVGDRPDPRWRRASLTLRGSDGVTREEFFNLSPEQRIALVHERVISRASWKPLTQLEIPKTHSAGETRPICWATVVDTALLYLLTDALTAYAETVLTDVAIAYRPGRAIDRSIRRVIQAIRRRDLYCTSVLDIQSFYDSLPWRRLDTVIDCLPADADIQVLLTQLVRVRIRKLDGSLADRRRGIPQGLPVSPTLANLALADFDKKLQTKLARLGAIVLRYSDDILIAAPESRSLAKRAPGRNRSAPMGGARGQRRDRSVR